MALFGSPAKKLLAVLAEPVTDWRKIRSVAEGSSALRDKGGVQRTILLSLMEKACESDSLPLDDFGAILRSLGSSGIDLNTTLGTRGETAVQMAVACGSAPILEALVLAGASPGAAFAGGTTPLHSAVSQSNLKIAELLVKSGADVNAEDAAGNTPLHLAVSQTGRKRMVDFLIRSGAVIWVRNAAGETPAMIAARVSGNPYTASIEKALTAQRSSRLLQWRCPVCGSAMSRPPSARVEWLVAIGAWDDLVYGCGRCGRRTAAPELDGER